MRKHVNRKAGLTGFLAASCIGMALSGCVAEESTVNTPVTNEPDAESATQTDSVDMPETTLNSQSLYEQFINNCVSATVSNMYPEYDYAEPIIEQGSSLTLTQLGERVSGYFLNPEYTDKTSYDYVQYAYVDCPDSANPTDKNLLIKFVGLNIYSQDDDSYAVFVITEDNGRLYVTDEYQCWARSATTAYANGTLSNFGSGGAGDHYDGLSIILSNGTQTPIYAAEILSGWWTSYVNEAIYSEELGENTEHYLVVTIYTIGDAKYYLYDTSECSEQEKVLCENYINRCRDELGIKWITEEEIQTAIRNQCSAIGVDYGITQQQEEAGWIDL